MVENSEIGSKIVKEMLSRVLFNILRAPTDPKYWRISCHALENILKRKCDDQCVHFQLVLKSMTEILNIIGFQKTDKCWYYGKIISVIGFWKLYRATLS